MTSQPDDFTCGPTCLHAIYQHFGDEVLLPELVTTIAKTPSGGTADVYLANDALRRGYQATIHPYNLRLFDPTWFDKGVDLADKLRQQARFKGKARPVLLQLTEAYCEFLALGGKIAFADLTPSFVRRHLKRGVPILAGLSSTYLYHHAREYGENDESDDIRGEPQGHFVVLCGYHSSTRTVLIADPFEESPLAESHHYEVGLDRVLGAIMLGVLTHDGSLVVIEPQEE
ncbi:MAG: C39 family peptidase [Planctomycetes bacterium]|nr:C39 family peptidase [Planctomycetota bacterium]